MGSLPCSLRPDMRIYWGPGVRGPTEGGYVGTAQASLPSPSSTPRGAPPTFAVLSIHSLDTS